MAPTRTFFIPAVMNIEDGNGNVVKDKGDELVKEDELELGTQLIEGGERIAVDMTATD